MKINSVTGPIDSSELGPTLIHEHINCTDWSLRMNFGKNFFDYDKAVETAAVMLKKMKCECGITTVVDGTPINLGRDVKLIRDVAIRSGVHLIASSGFYYQEEPGLMFRSEGEIADLLLNECQHGIGDTDILPGIMKTAVEKPEITPYLRKVISAVAHTAARTGLPVFCHHNVHNKNGGEILDIFESQGVAPDKVILGHSGDTDDLSYLTEMLNRGCYIGMDRFAYCGMTLSLERRAATIAALCKKGFVRKMLLSHDLVVDGFFGGDEESKNVNPEKRSPDFTFIHKTALPQLLKSGVTQEEFNIMMVENPRAFLGR